MKADAGRPTRKRLFRIASLVVPSALAWYVALSASPGDLADVVKETLGPVWLALQGALLVRACGATFGRDRGAPSTTLERIDVLTGPGTSLAWLSALAIVGAVSLGWASLAVVGLLGAGVFHLVVLYTFVVAGRADILRGGSVTRRFTPASVTEGDSVTEELWLSNVTVPIGFRMLVSGRVGARWATSRYVVEAAESGAEILLESEVGPAIRGEHDAEPLAVWLQDVFGICRSRRAYLGAGRLIVVPRLLHLEKGERVVDSGVGPREPRPASRMPTEGAFRLREYEPGDDVRRVHWLRSLAARELVVRLPDEIPPDRPRVRLVLDTHDHVAVPCDASAELLDRLVGVWLAVARSLAGSGSRVTLVTAIGHEGRVSKARQEFALHSPGSAQRLGAQVAWQPRMPVDELLTDEATIVVSRTLLTATATAKNARWIRVSPEWLSPEERSPGVRILTLPYPMGSADNRGSRRARERERIQRTHRDRMATLDRMRVGGAIPAVAHLVACPNDDGTVRLEASR